MRISKSAIALAVAAALPALSFVGSSDAGAASMLNRRCALADAKALRKAVR